MKIIDIAKEKDARLKTFETMEYLCPSDFDLPDHPDIKDRTLLYDGPNKYKAKIIGCGGVKCIDCWNRETEVIK